MKNHNPEMETNFINCINNMSLKRWHDHNDLVIDMEKKSSMTFEELCLSFDDIKDDVENHLGHFENISIRMH